MDQVAQKEQAVYRASTLEETKTVDFFDILLVLARDSRQIALIAFIAALIGLVVGFFLKPTYTAKAIILPPQQEQSSASQLLGSLGALASIGGGGGAGGGAGSLLKSPADMYIGILQSQTIADQLIKQFDLKSVYRTRTMIDSRAALKKHTEFESQKDGLIHITVEDHNAKRASDLANGYIDALYRMNSTLALTEASQRRLFFGQQVEDEKEALNKAEDDLAATQVKTGLIQPAGQAELIIRTIAQVQAEISYDQVALEGLLTSSTEQNPEVQRLRQEITALQGQLSKLQSDQKKLQPGDVEIPAGLVPQEALEYERKFRDAKYHEALFELLSKQYEAARIDEAKSAPVIQVVDRATPPDKKSGPHRLLVALGAGFAGALLASLWFLAANAWRSMKESPEYSVKFAQLQSSLWLRHQ
jgi:tyrosine-protein kinase Etk/Wzc